MLYISLCTIESHYIFYCSLLKSIDLINLEIACDYFAVKSLLVVCQVPPLDFIWCFKIFLWNYNILQLYIKCSDDWAPSSHRHIGLSINLNVWRYDFFPMSRVIYIFYIYIRTVFQHLVHLYDRSWSALCLRFCFRLYRSLCSTVLSYLFPLCSVAVQNETFLNQQWYFAIMYTSFCVVLCFVQFRLLLCYNFYGSNSSHYTLRFERNSSVQLRNFNIY